MVEFVTDDPIQTSSGMISISFTATDGDKSYTDAIVILPEQYNAMTLADIQEEEQRRWDEWIIASNPPKEEIING